MTPFGHARRYGTANFATRSCYIFEKKLITRKFVALAIDAAEKIVSAHEYFPETAKVIDLATQNIAPTTIVNSSRRHNHCQLFLSRKIAPCSRRATGQQEGTHARPSDFDPLA